MKQPIDHHLWAQKTKCYLKAAKEVLVETFWPTRCALCDRPGTLLCDTCKTTLPYIDYWRRCEQCGAPLGKIQCTECNPVMLNDLGMKKLPFTACISVLQFETAGARLITTYKDKNEQGLASILASMMNEVIPPLWLTETPNMYLSFIPSSKKAYRRRGFDHAERLASKLSEQTNLRLLTLFERPQSKDQRSLTRYERITNMEQRFCMAEASVPNSILLIDDVYTTGATLSFAAKKLLEAGAQEIRCVTFARVW